MSVHLRWTDAMAIGSPTIDSQHKKLILQSKRVVKAIHQNVLSNEAEKSLDYLEKYITEHFLFEENYMRQRKHCDLERHKKVHDKFMDEFHGLRHKLSVNSHKNPALYVEAIINMMIDHIKHENKEYYKFINNSQ